MADRRGKAIMVVLLLVAAAVALSVFARIGDPAITVRANVGERTPAPSTAAASGPVLAETEPLRSAILGRIDGVVRDGAGHPVAGIPVVLHRHGKRPSPPRRTNLLNPLVMPKQVPWPAVTGESAADGTFRFAELEPATYTVAAALGARAARDVVLAVGSHETVELQFAATDVLLHGQVRCDGAPSRDYQVELGQDARSLRLPLDADGRFRLFVAAGACTLSLRQTMRGAGAVTVAVREVYAAVGAEQVRCDFDVMSARLTAVLAEPAQTSDGPFEFVARGRCGPGGEQVEIVRPADENGVAVFAPIALGTWEVTVRGPCVAAAASAAVELTPQRPAGHATVAVRRAGLVRVRAVDLAGRSLTFGTRGPLLLVAGEERRGDDLQRGARRRSFGEEFGFEGVPPGRAELVCADREVDGAIEFLAFDPPPPRQIGVVAGDRNRIDLRVERRALVRLRAVDSVGRDDRSARIRVLTGDRAIASTESRAQRWRSHLPPGDYCVVVERPSGRRESGLVVGRRDVECILRP